MLGIRLQNYSEIKREPKLTIVDSQSYLNGSLAHLANKMVEDGKELELLKSSVLCSDSSGLYSDEKYKLLIRKGTIFTLYYGSTLNKLIMKVSSPTNI